jgi:hypothetical protein
MRSTVGDLFAVMKNQKTMRKTLDRSDHVLNYQNADTLVLDFANHYRYFVDLHVGQTGHHLVRPSKITTVCGGTHQASLKSGC